MAWRRPTLMKASGPGMRQAVLEAKGSGLSMISDPIHNGDILEVKVNGTLLAAQVRACVSARARRVGLLGERHIKPDGGVLLVLPKSRRGKAGPATAIHTLGMRFPIAAAWMDASGQVVHSQLARPWLPFIASPLPASFILEVHPEHLPRLKPGADVEWDPSSAEE